MSGDFRIVTLPQRIAGLSIVQRRELVENVLGLQIEDGAHADYNTVLYELALAIDQHYTREVCGG